MFFWCFHCDFKSALLRFLLIFLCIACSSLEDFGLESESSKQSENMDFILMALSSLCFYMALAVFSSAAWWPIALSKSLFLKGLRKAISLATC